MKEADFWSGKIRPKLVKACQDKELRHHFERVENRVADGTPDVDYIVDGCAGKIELKYSTNSVREDSQVLGKQHGLRRSQIIYAARYSWAGGRIYCMIGSPDNTWLLDIREWTPEKLDAISVATRQQLDHVSCWRASMHYWDELPELLAGR